MNVREYHDKQIRAEKALPPLTWPVDVIELVLTPDFMTGGSPIMLSYKRTSEGWIFYNYKFM